MYGSRKVRKPAKLTNGKHSPLVISVWETICNAALIVALLLLIVYLLGMAGII
jgi:hypothetical protein